MKTCIVGIILTKTNQTHSSNSTKYPQTIFNNIFSKLNKNSKSKKSKARNMKYFKKIRKPMPCS